MQDKYSAVILAAGCSSRMLQFKPMLPLGDMTIIERVIVLFKETGIEDIRVVVGHRRSDILPVLERHGVEQIVNPSYMEDMFSSVVAGLAGLAPDTEAFFILPVDIPLVRPATIRYLIETYQTLPGKIMRPSFKGLRGHPPLIPFAYARNITEWNGRGGLRGVLAQLEYNAIQVEVPDENILFDVDSPEDYEKLLVKWCQLDSESFAEIAHTQSQNL